MKKLILEVVRHGQSIENVWKEKCDRGEIDRLPTFLKVAAEDFPLTLFGIQQMYKRGQDMAQRGKRFDRFVVSPFLRARESAHALAEGYVSVHGRNLPEMTLEPRLVERNYGALQGMSHVEIAERYSKALLVAMRADRFGFVPPNGESLATVYAERLLPFFESASRRMQNSKKSVERWLCVSHSSTKQCMRLLLESPNELTENERLARMHKPANASVSRFDLLFLNGTRTANLVGWNQ